jgi:lipoprotein-releasing system ATP-binding protein
MSNDTMVTVERLTKTFTDEGGAFDVIKDASFTINKGEMVSLIGVSGAGKTTLLQILGGLDKATSGSIRIGGKAIDGMTPPQLAQFRNLQIGFVFQFHHLLPDFTALENVMLPGLIGGKSKEDCLPRARELLSIFNLDKRGTHFPSELSGGERQRVALARALYNEPALVLADEPTGNLDRANSRILLELFIRANKELNQTFIVATHNPDLSRGMQRTIYIEDGKIVSHD